MSLLLFSCLFVLFVHAPGISGITIQNAQSKDRIPQEYLITLNTEGWNLKDILQKQEKIEAVVKKLKVLSKEVEIVQKFVFNKTVILFVKSKLEASVTSLNLPEIDTLEANVAVKSTVTCSSQSRPEWSLSRIAYRDLPVFEKSYDYEPNDGIDTYAYVIDSGIYTGHDYFEGRATHGYTAPGLIGQQDGNGHGTHCAGSIMSSEFGVAKYGNAIAVKVLNDNGLGTSAMFVAGLEWVYNDFIGKGSSYKAVASMSLGASAQTAIDEATQDVIRAGLSVVVAAGNNDEDACNFSPARVPEAITVAASDDKNDLASYSNWGSCVDIIAPGSDVRSTYIRGPTSTVILSGTSMATPHVSGAILRHMSQLGRRPSPEEIKDWVFFSATVGRIDVRQTATTNRLLYAPCKVTEKLYDPSSSNMVYNNWVVMMVNLFVTLFVVVLH